MIHVETLTTADRAWMRTFLTQQAGAAHMVSRGRLHQCDQLAGLAARLDGGRAGLLNYRLEGEEIEVVTLYCAVRGRGLGSALLAAAIDTARRSSCRRLWLITTNDNQPAIDFYHRRGMRIAAVHRDALLESRRLKPEIPLVGIGGQPIRDEIEFEIQL